MKKTVIKTIAARPATPTKEVKKQVVICDICGKKTADQYGNERNCMVCNRDICRTHQTYDPNEYGDYVDYYCPICLDLLKNKYQKLYNETDEAHYKEKKRIVARFKKESLAQPHNKSKKG